MVLFDLSAVHHNATPPLAHPLLTSTFVDSLETRQPHVKLTDLADLGHILPAPTPTLLPIPDYYSQGEIAHSYEPPHQPYAATASQ